MKYYWNVNFVETNHKKDGTCQQATEPQTYYPVNQLDKIFTIPDNLILNLAMWKKSTKSELTSIFLRKYNKAPGIATIKINPLRTLRGFHLK